MESRIYFGNLFNIIDGFDELSKFYHIHRIKHGFPRWEVGDIKSSFDIEKRDSLNPIKQTRERVFEEIRKLEYSDYPSRDQCLFVIKEGEIEIWKECLLNGSTDYQILEIELINGKFIKLDESFFDFDNTKFEYRTDAILARDFWDGQSLEGHMKPAILFEGNFKVKKVVDEKSHDLVNNQ